MVATNSDFQRNLKLLCGRYRSISDICRRLKMNRQQFNKYLSGQSMPSLHSLRLLAEFFGVDETEFMMPHEEFVQTVFSSSGSDTTPLVVRREFRIRRAALRQSQEKLSPYVGYYNLYFRSPSWPGSVVRAAFVITQDAEATYAKNVERLARIGKRRRKPQVQKFEALVHYEGDRIFVLDRHVKRELGLSLTVIYPSKRSRLDYLYGLMLSSTSGGGNFPYATRIVLEFLGKDVDLKQLLEGCGVYPEGSDAIDEDIRQSTINTISDTDVSLMARWT